MVKKFIDKINREMIIQGVTRSELSKRLGVTRQTVTMFLSKSRPYGFTLNKMIKICECLDLNIDFNIEYKK